MDIAFETSVGAASRDTIDRVKRALSDKPGPWTDDEALGMFMAFCTLSASIFAHHKGIEMTTENISKLAFCVQESLVKMCEEIVVSSIGRD